MLFCFLSVQPYGVIFYGDSITESWNGLDHGFPVARAVGVDEVFRKHFGLFDARAFGIGGDESAHLLWRLLHGELPNGTTASGSSTSPRVAVLNIGTNDLGAARRGSTLSEAYASVNAAVPGVLQRIVQTVRLFRRAAPDTHLVLQALLPRSRDAGGDDQFLQPSVYTDALDSINEGLHALAAEDGHLHFVDCNDGLYDAADGSLVPELLPDGLHPSKDGYDRIGSCLAVTVRQLWDRSAAEFEAQRTAPATTRALPDGDAKAAEAHETIQALLAKVRAADEAGEGLDAKVDLPDDLGFVSKNGRGQVSAFPSLDQADRTKLHSVRGRRHHHHHHHRDDAERRHSGRHYGSAFRDRDHDRDRRRSRPAAAVALPVPLGSSKADEAEMRGIFDALKLVDDEAKRARREGRPDAKVVAILGDDGNGAVAMVQGGAAGASSVAVDAAGAGVSSKAVSGVHRVSTHLTLPLSMPALTLRPAVNAVNAEDLEKAQEAMNRAFGLTFGAATNSADPAASASAAAAASSLSSLVEGSMEAFSSISDAVIKAIRESLDAARPAAQAAGEVVQKAAQSAAQTAQKAAAEAAEASREATTEATEKAREAAAEASSEAQEAAAEATERARQAAAGAMEASHDAAEKAADAMRQAFGRLGK